MTPIFLKEQPAEPLYKKLLRRPSPKTILLATAFYFVAVPVVAIVIKIALDPEGFRREVLDRPERGVQRDTIPTPSGRIINQRTETAKFDGRSLIK